MDLKIFLNGRNAAGSCGSWTTLISERGKNFCAECGLMIADAMRFIFEKIKWSENGIKKEPDPEKRL